MEEWWARSGGLEVNESALTGLVSGGHLTPEDASKEVIESMHERAKIEAEAIDEYREKFPADAAGLFKRSEEYASGRFEILGERIDFRGDIDWHIDTRHGHRFDPTAFCSTIPHIHPDGGYDIKYPWELSRLQHLPQLALAYRISEDEKLTDELIIQAMDWIKNNPVGFGPNWACTMDVAIRAANLAFATAICGDRIGRRESVGFVRSLIAHGRFIRTHLEWSDELTSNHYLADIAGLALLASLISPEVIEAQEWLDFSHGELENEIRKQVYPDGCDFEASTAYHRLALECFLTPAIFIDRTGFKFSDEYYRKLTSMAEFVRDISMPDGSFPFIGDNDSGLFMSLQPRPTSDINYLLVLSAAFLKDPSLKSPGLNPSPEILWLLDIENYRWFVGAESQPRPEFAEYPNGGIYILRSNEYNDMVTFRLGPVGQNGNGGHAHNDGLSITVWFNGRMIIVDPGTACYTSDPEKRNMYRSTGYHSTIKIGDEEQNRFVDGNLFTLPEETGKAVMTGVDGSGRFVEGTMRGYNGWKSDEVTIRRKVRYNALYRKVEIEDTLVLSMKLMDSPISWSFPLAPGLSAKEAGGGKIILMSEGEKSIAEFIAGPGWRVKFVETFYSPSYGVEIPNITIDLTPPGGLYEAQFILRPIEMPGSQS